MRAAQWTTTSKGIENGCTFNSSATLPKNASSLPKNSTLVKVAYSTINPVDYKLPETPILRTLAFSKPATPCLDFSGHVVSTNRSDLKPGDAVFGKTEPPVFGALAEYAIVGPAGCVKLPPNTPLRDAAGLGVCGLTAYQTLAPYVKQPGMKIFINGGSGGVGTYTIQIAKILGCEVTTCCSGPNIDLCRSLGADDVLDYRSVDISTEMARRGTQFDLLIDNVNVGGSPLYYQSHKYLKPDAKYVTIAGDPSPYNILKVATMFLLPAALGGGQRKCVFVMCASNAEEYAVLGKWLAEGKLKTVVEEEFGLEEAGKAFARVKTGRARGKVVVRVGGGK